VLVNDVRLLLHKAKTTSAGSRDGAMSSKSKAVKVQVHCLPPLSRARLASESELWSSLCKQQCSVHCKSSVKLMLSPAPRRPSCYCCNA
jgi:hypothetical protein